MTQAAAVSSDIASKTALMSLLHRRCLKPGAGAQVTIEWVRMKGTAKAYRYFIFLNSSVRGPFYPSYMPPDWQWTQAYTARLTHSIKARLPG